MITNEEGAYEKVLFWLTVAKDNGNIISLGTDSHYCEEVGEFISSIKTLNLVDFLKERILNCNKDL